MEIYQKSKNLQNLLKLDETLFDNLICLKWLTSDMSLISNIEDDSTSDTIFENFSKLWCRLELPIEIVDGDMWYSEFRCYLAPRFFCKNMKKYSLHKNEWRKFLRNKSGSLTHARNTIIISGFYVLKTNKPHEWIIKERWWESKILVSLVPFFHLLLNFVSFDDYKSPTTNRGKKNSQNLTKRRRRRSKLTLSSRVIGEVVVPFWTIYPRQRMIGCWGKIGDFHALLSCFNFFDIYLHGNNNSYDDW